MQIRKMLPKDIIAVAALEKQCFSKPWSRRSLEQSYSLPSYCFLVAEEQDQIVGYMGTTIVLDEADVTNVAVDLHYRRKGIGERLLFHMIELCKKKGVSTMTLEVRSSNQAAIRLYKKMGFLMAGTRKNFYEKPIEDAIIMCNCQL